MNAIKEQLRLKYPFLNKTGIIHTSTPFDLDNVIQRWRNEKIIILMVGVQGAGKTTYCNEHFSDYSVINMDDIIINYLRTTGEMLSMEVNKKLNMLFFNAVERTLKERGVAIIDAGAVHMDFRILFLGAMQKKHPKVVLLVLNPLSGKIIQQVKGQLELRARPGLWEDIFNEYELLQHQIQNHILEMGVDEVYML